jgi:hypothetical protein
MEVYDGSARGAAPSGGPQVQSGEVEDQGSECLETSEGRLASVSCYRPVVMRADRNMPIAASGPVGSLSVRCGRCVGCRIDRARDWSLRCSNEALLHDHSTFLTLTYDDAHLPLTLVPPDLSGFVKRLRGRLGSFRFFGCGEYGDRFGRPHYHCLLFGCAPDRTERLSEEAFRSAAVAEAWPYGEHYAGSVTGASISYVAGYVAKKFGATEVGEYCDPETGALEPHVRPFARMSNRPAIGVPYLERYGMELLRGYAVRDGRKVPLPRYYRDWLKERFPDRMMELKRGQARFFGSEFSYEESGPQRLMARDRCARLSRAFFHPE